MLTNMQRERAIEQLMETLELDHDLEIGHLGASELIRVLEPLLVIPSYNQGIEDARQRIGLEMERIDEELDAMKKMMPRD